MGDIGQRHARFIEFSKKGVTGISKDPATKAVLMVLTEWQHRYETAAAHVRYLKLMKTLGIAEKDIVLEGVFRPRHGKTTVYECFIALEEKGLRPDMYFRHITQKDDEEPYRILEISERCLIHTYCGQRHLKPMDINPATSPAKS